VGRCGRRFLFYEVVRVRNDNPELAEIHGELGAVVGVADSSKGPVEYGVLVFRDEMCWQVSEDDLESTGKCLSRDELYSGERVRVRVDEEGRGSVAE